MAERNVEAVKDAWDEVVKSVLRQTEGFSEETSDPRMTEKPVAGAALRGYRLGLEAMDVESGMIRLFEDACRRVYGAIV